MKTTESEFVFFGVFLGFLFCLFQRHLLNDYLNSFYIVHECLLSSIQYLRDLNVIMSNEVEKKITKQNNFYKATLQGVPWEQGVDMD